MPGVCAAARCVDLCDGSQNGQSLSGGTRCLLQEGWCGALARELMAHPQIARYLPTGHVAVQCTYFEKSAQRNWLVPVHQDLSIAVRARSDAQQYSAWSTKEAIVFVQPPLAVLQSLVAVRLHLDACGPMDGPLHVIAGTHHRGVIGPIEAARLRQETSADICTVAAGTAMVMKPLLLHASSKAAGSSRRRVLHFVFGPPVLPFGVRWHHAVGHLSQAVTESAMVTTA